VTVEDELAIRNVVANMSRFADDGTVDDYVGLFTEDAEWLMPGAPRRGRADIRAGSEARRAEGTTGPGSHTRHALTTITVQVDGDTARSASTWLFFTGTDQPPPTLRLVGTYTDTLVRTPDGWRVARREIVIG
jgi:uncharacterized protein (TIGR02246 family)